MTMLMARLLAALLVALTQLMVCTADDSTVLICGGARMICVRPVYPSINNVRVRGAWTWFTYNGTLFRKHEDSIEAEVWYHAVQTASERSGVVYDGFLLDESRLAHHTIYTEENSPISCGWAPYTIRFDSLERVWAKCTVAYDTYFLEDQVWKTVKIPSMIESLLSAVSSPTPQDRALAALAMHYGVWYGSPFDGDSAYTQEILDYKPTEALLSSIRPDARDLDSATMELAVYDFELHPNGNIWLSTPNGIHVFRPLDEGEVKRGVRIATQAPYPNPASTSVTFALEGDRANKMTIDIQDLAGRLRLQGIEGTTKRTVVDVTGLEEGVYIALMKSGGSNATTTFTVRR